MNKELALYLKRRVSVPRANARRIRRRRCVILAIGRGRVRGVAETFVLRRVGGELLTKIGADSHALNVRNVACGDAVGCLLEKPRRILESNLCGRRCRWCRRGSGRGGRRARPTAAC